MRWILFEAEPSWAGANGSNLTVSRVVLSLNYTRDRLIRFTHFFEGFALVRLDIVLR